MELFVVNRYQPGDDTNGDSSHEEKIKNKLITKIEERKRKLAEVESNNTEDLEVSPPLNIDEVGQNESEPAKRKRKKKKKTTDTNIVVEEVIEEEPTPLIVLGKDDHKKREKTKRVLPHWLKNASVVSVDLKNLEDTVDSISNLDASLVDLLKKNNITHFFPVQSQVIPWLLKTLNWPTMYWPSDVCVSAPTGSGKTLAFVLPVVQALKNRLNIKIRAMAVLPVQDLAKQVYKVFLTYVANTQLKVVLLSSATSLVEEQKLLVTKDALCGFKSRADIIVTTPGRLVDHLKATDGFCLGELRYLIIDEADRVMESVQNDWLYHLNTHMGLHSGISKSFQVPPLCLRTLTSAKRPPQKLLFSATLSQDPEKLQQLGLFQPKLFTSIVKSDSVDPIDENSAVEGDFVGKFTTPAELKESYVECTESSKPLVLFHLLRTNDWRQVLCFTSSREATRRLATLLKALCSGSFKVSEITSNLTPFKRNSRLKQFSTGQLNVLICSDALARGIDLPNVQCVISYTVPNYIKNHVHRVGRTGRAGQEGVAVTLLLSKEIKRFKEMMLTGRKTGIDEIVIADDDLAKYEDQYKEALEKVKKKVDITNALKKSKVVRWKKNIGKNLVKQKKKVVKTANK